MRIKVVFASHEGGYPREEIEKRKECVRRYTSPEVDLDFDFLEGDTGTVYKAGIRQVDFDRIAPALLRKALEAEHKGFDAFTQFGTADDSLEVIRPQVKIPVVGWGKATYNVAALMTSKMAVIVYEESAIPHNRVMAEKYRVDHLITSFRSVKIPLSEMSQRRDELKVRLIETCRAAVAEGAELIYPHGVSMIPLHYLPEEIEREVGVPILNAVDVGMRMVELVATLRWKKA